MTIPRRIIRALPLWRHMASIAAVALCLGACSASARTFDARDPHSPLRLVRTIVLPEVRGRIDHMNLDGATNHLFVAELGNGTVDDVDLFAGKVVGRISGLHEPQGVAWLPVQRELAVACGDGLVRFFRRADWREVARIALGDDADNVRIDPRNGHLIVGYGSGGLAVIDPATHRLLGRVALGGHPEAFAIESARAFVNVPGRHSLVIVDLDFGRAVSTVPIGMHAGNYPMALKAQGSALAVAFRMPASVSVIDTAAARTSFSVGSCGDADDLYFVGGELAVVCGQGVVDLIRLDASHTIDRITTSSGARTGLLAPDGKTLFIAVPNHGSTARLWQLELTGS